MGRCKEDLRGDDARYNPYELALDMPEIGITEPMEPYQIKGKAEFTAKLQNLMCVMDALISGGEDL